jgi:MoaA/NifB/PqqE/SkfB family radical SAM enzyme
MDEVKSIAFALDPTNVPSFLLDWEVTKLCNLDCSYCGVGIDGGHDNSTKHPPLAECLRTINFMYQYVDLYMQHKKPSQRKVILNVYGGESLFHPDIVEILKECRNRYKSFEHKWHLTITCTTNGVVGENQWRRIVPLIDEFTMSYHSENLPKQKQQYKDNILYLKEQNKRFKCAIMMHNNKELFKDSELIIEFCKENNLRYVLKPLDNVEPEWKYSVEQFSKLKTFWVNKVPELKKEDYQKFINTVDEITDVSSINEGRPCCGGRKLSLNGDLKSCVSYVPKQGFQDWYCSVNWFFLFVQQLTGNIYTNKDCRTSTTGQVEPLGNLSNYQTLLDQVKTQLDKQAMPVIKCVKDICMCGFCAPKADNLNDFKELLDRNLDKEKYYGNQTI